MSIFDSHPQSLIFETSNSLRVVPSGLLVSYLISPLKPIISLIVLAKSTMLISVPVPIFRWVKPAYKGYQIQDS